MISGNESRRAIPRILLVDDDPVVINTLRGGLTDRGYLVDAYECGLPALSEFGHRPPDIAVLDIGLPDISGTDLAARMLEVVYRPIIILSGHSDADNVKRAIGNGVVGYLVKPLSAAQLVPSIETALARFADMNKRLARHFDAQQQHGDRIDVVLDQFTMGLVIIDHERHIVNQNKTARRTLNDAKFLTNRGGKLCTAGSIDGREFKRVLGKALSPTETTAMGTLVLENHLIGTKIQIWVSPLGVTQESDKADRSAIVMLIDPTQPVPGPEPLIKSMYGLTDKESKLATALLNGQTVDEYCRCAHVTHNTARTQLKSIYRKTNTRGQVDLVRLLSRLLVGAPIDH